MSEARTYRGWIGEFDYGEAMNVVFLTAEPHRDKRAVFVDEVFEVEPLAKVIEEAMDDLGHYLSVRYFVSDREQTAEELAEGLIRQLVGAGEAEYRSHYSEITGYLWTDEELKVGGHDLLDELRSHVGKFCHLEIEYHRAAQAPQEPSSATEGGN